MVQITGSYQHVETTNAAAILKASGEEVTDQKLAGLNSPNSKLIIEGSGNDYTFTTTVGESFKREVKFTIGKEFQEDLKGLNPAKTIVTRNGDNFIFASSSGGKSGSRTYVFSDNGVVLNLDLGSGSHAKRVYKRI